VVDGVVTAISTGIAKISVATADNTYSDTCTVTVLPNPITNTALQNITVTSEQGDNIKLVPTFDPNIYEYTVLLPCPVEDRVLYITASYSDSNAITFGGKADVDGVITVNADELGNHIVTVILTLPGGATKTYTLIFHQRASSELLFRLWDDMIIVNLNEETNGGYEFTGFKWYRNSEPTGDAGKYLLVDGVLINGGEYYVELTTSTGKVFETCPYIYTIPKNADIKVYPNPIVTGNILTIENISDAQKALFYDISGHLLQTYPLDDRQRTLQIPVTFPNGIYTVRTGNKSQKFIVIK
jgi:hypothetical protein